MNDKIELHEKLCSLPFGDVILSNTIGTKIFNLITSSENGIDALYEIVNNKNTNRILSSALNIPNAIDNIDEILDNPMLLPFVKTMIVNNDNSVEFIKTFLDNKNTTKFVENIISNPEFLSRVLGVRKSSSDLMSFLSNYFTCDTSKDILYGLQDNDFFIDICTDFFNDPYSGDMLSLFYNMKDYQKTLSSPHIKNFFIHIFSQKRYINGYKDEFMKGKFFRSALSKKNPPTKKSIIYNKMVYIKLTLFLFRMGMYYADEHIDMIDSALKRTPMRIGYNILKSIIFPLYKDYDSISEHIKNKSVKPLFDIMEKHIYNFPVEFHKSTFKKCLTEKDIELYNELNLDEVDKCVNYLMSTLNHYLDFLVVVARVVMKIIF